MGVAARAAAGAPACVCGARGTAEADGGWTRPTWQHLDGNAFLVSVGNVRQVQREEQRTSGGGSDDEEEEEDASLQPLDEVSGGKHRGHEHKVQL